GSYPKSRSTQRTSTGNLITCKPSSCTGSSIIAAVSACSTCTGSAGSSARRRTAVQPTGCSMGFVSICPEGCRRGVRRAALALIVAAAVAGAAAQTDSPGVYHAGTDLVVLQVAVTNTQRRFVSGLRAENFAV